MLRFTRAAVAAVACSLFFSAVGCAVDAEPEIADSSSEEALSTAGRALIGAYTASEYSSFRALVLLNEKVGQANKFFADVDTGVRCVRAPCPSSERIEGTFTAGTKTITLKSTTASVYAQHLLGKYNYSVQGDALTIARGPNTHALAKVTSYCGQPTDCGQQALVHPMCVGSWTCTASSTCGYHCGGIPVVPADPCEGLSEFTCASNPSCDGIYGPSVCAPNGLCTADHVFKRCESKPVVDCANLDEEACNANTTCHATYGPSACTPEGLCTADIRFKGCATAGQACMSSSSCAADSYCTTEVGVCNPTGMLAVCSGTCEKGPRQPL